MTDVISYQSPQTELSNAAERRAVRRAFFRAGIVFGIFRTIGVLLMLILRWVHLSGPPQTLQLVTPTSINLLMAERLVMGAALAAFSLDAIRGDRSARSMLRWSCAFFTVLDIAIILFASFNTSASWLSLALFGGNLINAITQCTFLIAMYLLLTFERSPVRWPMVRRFPFAAAVAVPVGFISLRIAYWSYAPSEMFYRLVVLVRYPFSSAQNLSMWIAVVAIVLLVFGSAGSHALSGKRRATSIIALAAMSVASLFVALNSLPWMRGFSSRIVSTTTLLVYCVNAAIFVSPMLPVILIRKASSGQSVEPGE